MKKFDLLAHVYDIVDERVKDGYVELRIVTGTGGYRWKKRYKLVYGLHNGPLEYGKHIHHKDFDKSNDHSNNLMQITREEHAAIHGVVYNVKGVGGKRMLGKKHSKETKAKMRKAALGSKKSLYFRTEEDKAKRRKLFGRLNNGQAKSDITISKVMDLLNKGWTQRKVARFLGCSRQVIRNRIDWHKEDLKWHSSQTEAGSCGNTG